MRAEGLTERVSDIILQCSGSPGTFTGSVTLFLSVGVTNRVDATNMTRDAVVSVDLGGGVIVPIAVAGLVSGNSISFTGISYTVPASGNVILRISNVRGAMNQLGLTSVVPAAVTASLSTTSFALDQATVTVAFAQAGMLSNMGGATITCVGSPLPDTFDLPSLFAAGTSLASTRITEGFASAFEVRAAGADAGTRFLVKYSGFPSTTRLFIPDAVAGSDAQQPTSGGDLNLKQAVGQYVPGSGTLVLVRVPGADSNGAGGAAGFVATPPQGMAAVTLSSVSEVALTNGSGYAVYEVADANANTLETAQFPTFIVLPRFTPPTAAQETVALGPVSAVNSASTSAPVPRFTTVGSQGDCKLFGDCVIPVVQPPKLSIEAGAPLHLSAVAAGGAMTSSPGTFKVHNIGSGSVSWTTNVVYQQGSGWLTLSPSSGTNEGIVQVTAQTTTLSGGLYSATIVANGGAAGSQSVGVFLQVSPAPAPPAPPPPATPSVVVSQVLNAATLQAAPMVAGSLTTLMGSHLSGKIVAVTFDGTPGTVIYSSDTQINILVPAALGSRNAASLVVTVDGVGSTPMNVPLAAAWPAVFAHGVFNQNNLENTPANAAKAGDILQMWGTGIPKLATVSVQIGDHKDLVPLYAGDAPGVPGVQQVNVAVPTGVAGPLNVLVCASTGGQQYCSPAYSITVQ